MIMKSVSICIPSYNRPIELKRLLDSIDSKCIDKVEIIVCEDKSNKREEIREVAHAYSNVTKFNFHYHENEVNLGYDRNIKNLVNRATNDFIIFMGDDDVFIPNALDKMIGFLSNNPSVGYVLKSHRFNFNNGTVEHFKYFKDTRFFEPGIDTYVSLFRRSVFISGFTINRHYIEGLETSHFDGSLLYQLYLLAEVALKYNCAYFDEPLTKAFEEGIPYFGSSETEKGTYTPGTITVDNSLNFLKGFTKITEYIDTKYSIDATDIVKRDMSKYFYPSLAIQRDKGLKVFVDYVKELNNIGFNCTIYYYIYVISLIVLGKSTSDKIIASLKKRIGYTPQL